MSEAPAPHAANGIARPVVLAFLLVTAATQLPYLVASLSPPPGFSFIGTFYYPTDVYNYMSYAQQAEDGALLFRNKLAESEHAPALLNLEWLALGWMSKALGGGALFVAWRVLALFSAAAFFVAAARSLRGAGLAASHLLPALLLVASGGGLGGVLFALGTRGFTQCWDLYAGFFPAIELLANPHFVTGTALLLLAMDAFARSRPAAGVALGSALAVVRPYDFVLLVAIVTLSVIAVAHRRRWLALLLPLAGLLPAAAYLYWLFYTNPAFAFYAQTPYSHPGPLDLAWALGPAVLLAAAVSRAAPAPADQSSRLKRAQLVAWSAAALGVALLRPLNFSTQFLVGAGFPLLALAALGLSRFRPAVTLWVALPFCSTLLVALGFVLEPRPQWLVPTERLRVVDALRAECRKGDRVFAPEDIGLFAFGTTPCGAFVSHPIAPSYASRRAELASFSRGSREHRARLLDDSAITLLVLPHDDGPVPASWLPDATPFRRVSTIEGGSSRWSLYRRKAVTDPRPF